MIRWMVSILSDYYLVQSWLQITIYSWSLHDESTVRNYWAAAKILAQEDEEGR
jgi:hypothetical protein